MEKHEYITLFEKHLAGNTSAEEEQMLMDHRDEFKLLDLPWDSITMGNQSQVKERLYNSLQAQINPVPVKRIPARFWYAAASVLIIFSSALYYGLGLRTQERSAQPVVKTAAPAIIPGGNKAILTLANGSQVDLNDKDAVKALQQGDALVSNKEAGLLVYNRLKSGKNQAQQFNKISIPRGGKYDVILSDGTKVWLNASSSLYFPTTFSGDERRVVVTGEAYFEVAKNAAMPFKVEANGTVVRVLGTHFNVMAYEDEAATSTTLLEGSVEISNNSGKALLKPGQQALVNKSTGTIDVNQVNAAQFMAWKEGKFVFTDDGIEEIMRKLSRWYDVEVVYRDRNLADKIFNGTISRYENISEVLSMLEQTGTIHFKVAGRRITVMP
ncbi:FecR family protein [Pedobacter frigoris]|uniref:DUF4974 domain-containing protein n=1 Tax=Pedobacter frigoris TaxID=2571272 RepID=A0A4U1CP08_9SPHI|nr:FecR domain-containing protein [Pedobacter frigoris]TKC07134.1 DUF4974 domain-containing protein [Pedobacter frigoris]